MNLFPNPCCETTVQQESSGSESTAANKLCYCTFSCFRDLVSTLEQNNPQKKTKEKKHRRKERTIHWLLAFSCISYYLIKSLLSLRRSQPILISFGMITSTCLPFNSPNRLSYMDNFIVTCCSLLSLVFITVLFFSVLLTHLHPMGQNNTSFGVEGWMFSSAFMTDPS